MHIYSDLVHWGLMVGMRGASRQASMMHICWMQVVTMVKMMLQMDVVFFIVICYHLHSALGLQKKDINNNIYNAYL